MAKIQTVFKRYEKKYLLHEAQYQSFLLQAKELMHPDQYGQSTICNIYFDTPDSRLIRTSLEKPVYKEKLRLRSYGVPDPTGKVFVELKKKYKGVVYKRREAMPLAQAESYLYSSIPLIKPTQITREIDWFLQYYPNLRPAMFLSYDRVALYGEAASALRVTFDSNILYRRERLYLNAGVWGTPLLTPDQHLMEIKIEGSMPLWLSHLLNELEIYPVSFSKYGRSYLNILNQNTPGGQYSA